MLLRGRALLEIDPPPLGRPARRVHAGIVAWNLIANVVSLAALAAGVAYIRVSSGLQCADVLMYEVTCNAKINLRALDFPLTGEVAADAALGREVQGTSGQ